MSLTLRFGLPRDAKNTALRIAKTAAEGKLTDGASYEPINSADANVIIELFPECSKDPSAPALSPSGSGRSSSTSSTASASGKEATGGGFFNAFKVMFMQPAVNEEKATITGGAAASTSEATTAGEDGADDSGAETAVCLSTSYSEYKCYWSCSMQINLIMCINSEILTELL